MIGFDLSGGKFGGLVEVAGDDGDGGEEVLRGRTPRRRREASSGAWMYPSFTYAVKELTLLGACVSTARHYPRVLEPT